MNVDGAFILAETHRKTSVLLFIDSRFINYSDEFGKMFVACIALAHALKKPNKNVPEQLTSNSVLAQIFKYVIKLLYHWYRKMTPFHHVNIYTGIIVDGMIWHTPTLHYRFFWCKCMQLFAILFLASYIKHANLKSTLFCGMDGKMC